MLKVRHAISALGGRTTSFHSFEMGDEYISIEIVSPGAGQAVAEIHRFQNQFTFIRKGVFLFASRILFIRVVPVFFQFSRILVC